MKKILVAIGLCTLLIALERPLRGSAGEIWSIEDIKLLAAAMELENGCNSNWCLMLTGSVIMNRVNSPNYPDTVYGVLHQPGQYAQHTVKNLYTVKVSDRVMCLALKLTTLNRPVDPEIVYQSQYSSLGKVKYVVDGEYFATAK